jgi:hypothetical protein
MCLVLAKMSGTRATKVPRRTPGSGRSSLLLEIPLERLPHGTRLQIDTKSLLELLDEQASSIELVVDRRAAPGERARALFLAPAEMERGEVTVGEAAKALGITRQAVLLAIKRSALKARRVGPVFLVDVASINAYRPRRKTGTPQSVRR